MSGDETTSVYLLQRVLVLSPDREAPAYSAKCKFHFQPKTQTINFAQTFKALSTTYPHLSALLQDAQLFFLDQQQRTQHFLGQFPLEDCHMFFDDWTTSSIVISYRKHKPATNQQAALPCRKSRERTIREVKAEIERWRQAAQENYACGSKGITLSKAAKSIGLSKKSLDDYLRYLRIGERLNFDFKAFQSQKMGFLRAYVRDKQREPMPGSVLQEIQSYWDSNYISKEDS